MVRPLHACVVLLLAPSLCLAASLSGSIQGFTESEQPFSISFFSDDVEPIRSNLTQRFYALDSVDVAVGEAKARLAPSYNLVVVDFTDDPFDHVQFLGIVEAGSFADAESFAEEVPFRALLTDEFAPFAFLDDFRVDSVSAITDTRIHSELPVPFSSSLITNVEFNLQEAGLEADFDRNGVVDFSDFLLLSTQFGQPVDPPGAIPDISGNGLVDFEDFLTLTTQFGRFSNSPSVAVPEPSRSAGIFGLAATIIVGFSQMRIRRRRRTEQT